MKSFTVSTKNILNFRRKLLSWYRSEGRDLPWRKTHDPYRILVSEIMLQQTQVDRVKEKYREWLKAFPTVHDLAKAPTSKVLKLWSGLGYNRRALALQQAAKQIVLEHNGTFPDTVEELMKLKGVGRYTASAVVSFAFRKPVPIVDTNVKRVLGRIFFGYKTLARHIQSGKTNEEPFWELKRKVVPNSKNSYDFNQGIMDFGAMVCTARQPSCNSCPMKNLCASYPEILNANAQQLRVKKRRKEPLYYGKPRRIWRGKILQALNSSSKKQLSLQEIGKQLQADWNAKRLQWLKDVVQTMERDGLVKTSGTKVALP